MALTAKTLTRCGVPDAVARAHLPHMLPAMREFGITTRPRARAFLATTLHESLGLRRMNEIGGGRRYEGRRGLGNRRTGDGERFKGRGPIQLTGRANYETYGRLLGLDLVKQPDIVATPQVGWRVAACYFAKRPGLLAAADAGDFRRVTRLVNGGYNGWDDRARYWRILGSSGVVPGARDLKKGARGRDVALATRRLARLKSRRTGRPYLDAPRATFDARTARALRAFQREHELKPDGVLDPLTAAVLEARTERAATPATPGPASAPAAAGPPSPPDTPRSPKRPAATVTQDRIAQLWERLERLDRQSDRVREALATAAAPPPRDDPPGPAVAPAAPSVVATAVAPVAPPAVAPTAPPPAAPPAFPPAAQSAALFDGARVDVLERVNGSQDSQPAALASQVAEPDGKDAREELLAVAGELERLSERVRAVVSPADVRPAMGAVPARAADVKPATGPASEQTGRYLELLARLDALDAKADRIRRILRAASSSHAQSNGNGKPSTPVSRTRTFRVASPEMKGEDIRSWQREVNRRLASWRIEYELAVDGEYGKETERWSKRLLHGLGVSIRDWQGVTPAMRVKARHPKQRTPAEVATARKRRAWLLDLRRTHRNPTGVKAAVAYAKRHADRRTAETRTNGGPFIDDWCRMVHIQPGTSYAHWCGAFANACLVEAGLPSRDWIRYTPSIVNNAKRGVEGWSWHARPRVGDLVLFDWPGGDFVDHVGIVAEVHGDGSVTTVEGNFRNRVGYWRRKAQILGYARPPWKRAAVPA